VCLVSLARRGWNALPERNQSRGLFGDNGGLMLFIRAKREETRLQISPCAAQSNGRCGNSAEVAASASNKKGNEIAQMMTGKGQNVLCADGNEVLESVRRLHRVGLVFLILQRQSYADKLGARNAVADDSAQDEKLNEESGWLSCPLIFLLCESLVYIAWILISCYFFTAVHLRQARCLIYEKAQVGRNCAWWENVAGKKMQFSPVRQYHLLKTVAIIAMKIMSLIKCRLGKYYINLNLKRAFILTNNFCDG
jgi:hypothetical protein